MSDTLSSCDRPAGGVREVHIGTLTIGGTHPVMLQSMCATKTYNIDQTVEQITMLHRAGAGLIRLAVDNLKDAASLGEIRRRTHNDTMQANLSVDLQENYTMAEMVAPWVDKLRYNPGHLYHYQPEKPWQDKVRYLVDLAVKHGCALRIGVNSGSVDPAKAQLFSATDTITPMLDSALAHAQFLDSLGFDQYCVSLKDSDPYKVMVLNQEFARQRPDVPLHLGVTEAGLPPLGVIKTRLALEPLLANGIGSTLRVSLTVPASEKYLEIEEGRKLLEDMENGLFTPREAWNPDQLNIISCPSCARVENSRFVELAQQIRDAVSFAAEQNLTIAVMGCRVNGPGESDHADLGVWCGLNGVNLKRRGELLGMFSYDEIIPVLVEELKKMIAQ